MFGSCAKAEVDIFVPAPEDRVYSSEVIPGVGSDERSGKRECVNVASI